MSIPVTGSLKVARKVNVSALVGLVGGVFKVKDVTLGVVVSITIALFAPSEFVAPGRCKSQCGSVICYVFDRACSVQTEGCCGDVIKIAGVSPACTK